VTTVVARTRQAGDRRSGGGGGLPGWADLRHAGLLLDPQRLAAVAEHEPAPVSPWVAAELRRRTARLLDDGAEVGEFVAFVLEQVCGFKPGEPSTTGTWLRGSAVPADWGRQTLTGETVKPRHIWRGPHGAVLPVFVDDQRRVGMGRGRKTASQVVQWLRATDHRLALLTNGRQWRLVFAGLDIDAWCEWDSDLWLEEGELAPQVQALRTLVQPALWTPSAEGERAVLERAVLDSRKGQAELSSVLGERVREAVELLVQAHGEALREHQESADERGEPGLDPADIYRAAVRMVMRMVVVLFAESRELLPRDNVLYNDSYGLTGLIGRLEKAAARGGARLAHSHAAWPRVLALFRLVSEGSAHPALSVPAYGGELFAPGDPASPDGLTRALAVFERACFARELLSDRDVHRTLELISRTRVRLRQGRGSTWVTMPVDFSDLSSEYIGILYEGLLDFELKTAPPGDPVIFLAVGNTPALPLSRLEAMDDRVIAGLLDKMKDASSADEPGDGEGEGAEDADADDAAAAEEDDVGETVDETTGEVDGDDVRDAFDERHTTRTRAETWARRAVLAGRLVRAPRGALTPERRLAYDEAVARTARRLVERVVLPGEWYVVRWGGTRKGSGTFYTRPGLAVPTVQRTLRPLAFDPPTHADGTPNADAPPVAWKPKSPEDILALKVCDPACGSGTFPVAALRYLTDALYESLHFHDRITQEGERALVRLFEPSAGAGPVPEERLGQELLPCRPDDDTFESRLKALLRRHVVERCIYGVDLDPLAVELCRLSLWIETMDRELPFGFLDHKIKCGNALVGAWFDTFRHYPVMAFKNREGGDKGHGNGVHFVKGARGKALKAFVKDVLTPDLRTYITREIIGQLQTHERGDEVSPAAVHDLALGTLARLHDLPVQDAAERARIYRDELVGSPLYQNLKAAMDLWCACWFWPADRLDEAPLPTTLHAPSERTAVLAAHIAAQKRFFHWELEFPDVFRTSGAGFDAVLGNPPWETLQPNSKEYFSNIDPLYRSYGKQDALRYQTDYFAAEDVEQDWLDFSAGFADYSNWMKHAAGPFGDPAETEASSDRFSVARGNENISFHERWREARTRSHGYCDARHPFRHRGEGKAYTYKLFLEQAHALLRLGGRLGFVVPSGLYSDHGTGSLRELFLDHCRWEWLFGFENRDGIFDIHRSFKFNPVVIEKGGRTAAIRAAFMRRALEDWERAEELAVPYAREQVERFSPRSRAILEIQSARDLEILGKIYANSVLLGDDGPDGWGVKYAQGDFNMTSDSKLFPPRPVWEAKGYRPDEYSRWLLGDWRPIEELWAELGIDFRPDPSGPGANPNLIVNPNSVVPVEVELEDWLFDTTAGPERRMAEARFVHGHLLKPGDVARTDWRLRCAQWPYDSLPVPRADIPAGIILSREAVAWIREEHVEDIALPLYQGVMMSILNPYAARHVAGVGANAVWDRSLSGPGLVNPAFLIDLAKAKDSRKWSPVPRLAYRRIARTTDVRTVIATALMDLPAGDSLFFYVPPDEEPNRALSLAAAMSSFWYDHQLRLRLGGTNLSDFIMAETAVPRPRSKDGLVSLGAGLTLYSVRDASTWLSITNEGRANRARWYIRPHSRLEKRTSLDAIVAVEFGMAPDDVRSVLDDCDLPSSAVSAQTSGLRPTGFWRVDKDKDPELRHTVLTLVAFHDLEEKIRACGGDREAGIEAFLGQNDGEGWMLPETLRLADYGLGRDERARHPQPVASRLGPRFYDWQLAQSAEESWRECHLHARNLLGKGGYRELAELSPSGDPGHIAAHVPRDRSDVVGHPQDSLFE